MRMDYANPAGYVCRIAPGWLLLVLAVLSSGLTVPPLRLTAPRCYVTGPLPSQAIPADLDDDGDLDVIVRSVDPFGTATLQLFRNPGDGTLLLQTSVPAVSADRLASGDLNHDGRLDLVQPYKTDTAGGFGVYRRNGPFSFGQTTQTLSFRPGRVAVGQLDGAGGPDLAIGDFDLPHVYVYLDNGAGGFALHGMYDTDPLGDVYISEMVCSDLDGDGRDDLAVTHYAPPESSPRTNNISWLHNLGGGTLSVPHVILDGWGGELAIADLDADGDADILTADTATAGPDNEALILLRNLGLGTFATPQRFASGSGTFWVIAISLADVDLDGDLDAGLLFSDAIPGNPNDKPTAHWSLVHNDATAQFGPPQLYPTGAAPLDLAFADLDGVYGPEALTTAADDARLIVHYNEFGGYPSPQIIPVQDPQATLRGTEVTDIAAGDFNSDGRCDLAVIGGNSGFVGEGPDTLFILNGTATGISPAPVPIDLPRRYPLRLLARQIAGSVATDLAVIFTGDSILDPATGVGLSLGTTGALPAAMQFQGLAGGPSGVASFDFDLDGIKDLAILRLPGSGGLTCVISILRVDNTGAMTYLGDLVLGSNDPLTWDARQSYAISSGDIDGDGIEDLVGVSWPMGSSQSVLSVILYKGEGQFLLREYATLGPTVTDVQAVDVTGDGRPEVILTRVPSLIEGGDGATLVYPNTGDGYLGTPASYNVGTGPVRVRAAQMDGQPGLDLVVSCDAGNELAVLYNDGSGGFAVQERYMPAGGSDALSLGDLDADGDPDVALLNVEHAYVPNQLEYRGTVSILANRWHWMPGDVNADGHVNTLDLLAFAGTWDKRPGQPGYNARCDLDGNNTVNVVDLLILADDWGS